LIKFNILTLIIFYTINLYASSNDILNDISQDMKHYNVVATQTRQNEAYQPYIISTFKGKELEKVGIKDLKEALTLAPSVDMATDNANIQTPVFRGSNPLAYGQTKLFIDGVLVNNLFLDAFSEYLALPIEMIKRIEITRGPGSKTEGINVYAGSVNVVTYAEDCDTMESSDRLAFKYGSYDYKMGGFMKSFKADELKVFVDFFYQKDDKKIFSGPDGVSQGALGAVNIPLSQSKDAPLWLEDYSLGLNMTYKDFTLKGRILKHTQGSAYGINFALPQERDRVKLPSSYLELGYSKKISDYTWDIKVGLKYDIYDSKAKLGPNDLNLSGVIFPNGAYGEHYAKQRTWYQSSYLKYSGFAKHTLITGYRVVEEKTIDMSSKLSNLSTGSATLVDYTQTRPFFDANAKRDVGIFSLQDDYTYSDKLSFLYGFNYELTSYEDAGFEPRVSMVYKIDSNDIFKAMYSRAHRNPSWQEMFTKNNRARVGSTALKPEKVDAFEMAYIKKFTNSAYIQTNLFYLLNKDQIYNSATDPVYRNIMDTDLYGFEIEYKTFLSPYDKLYANYAYVDGNSRLHTTNEKVALANVAHHLAKGYYTHSFKNGIALSTIAKYVGAKDRTPQDSRSKVDEYITLDTTLYYKNTKYNYTLTGSIKNIFDAKVVYPSPANTYVDDYVQEGRNFLITLTKGF
jgi:iron complex outermembrane receptor protein